MGATATSVCRLCLQHTPVTGGEITRITFSFYAPRVRCCSERRPATAEWLLGRRGVVWPLVEACKLSRCHHQALDDVNGKRPLYRAVKRGVVG